MQPYKLAIFDWDGTLADSISVIVDSVHKSAEELNLPLLADQAVKDIIGLKLDSAIAKLYPELTAADLNIFLEKYAKHFIRLEKQSHKLFPNVLKILEELKQNGYFLAIATGKSRKGLDRILNALELTDFFDASRCADETAGKPNPKMLNDLLMYFGLDNQQAIMVGDATFDLQMANNASLASIAVSYGAQKVEALKQYQPIAIIDDFAELAKYLIKP